MAGAGRLAWIAACISSGGRGPFGRRIVAQVLIVNSAILGASSRYCPVNWTRRTAAWVDQRIGLGDRLPCFHHGDAMGGHDPDQGTKLPLLGYDVLRGRHNERDRDRWRTRRGRSLRRNRGRRRGDAERRRLSWAAFSAPGSVVSGSMAGGASSSGAGTGLGRRWARAGDWIEIGSTPLTVEEPATARTEAIKVARLTGWFNSPYDEMATLAQACRPPLPSEAGDRGWCRALERSVRSGHRSRRVWFVD